MLVKPIICLAKGCNTPPSNNARPSCTTHNLVYTLDNRYRKAILALYDL